MKSKTIIVTTIAGLTLLVVHFFGSKLGTFGMVIEMNAPGLIRLESWLECLEADPTSHGYSIYGFLEERKTEKGIELALEHIYSDDPYLWLNAATYLGSMHRKEAVPLLIKSIRHTAHKSRDERIELLNALTGLNHGDEFEVWKEWYMHTDPEYIPDWDSSLGRSPRLNQSQLVEEHSG
jgi:hypothetical protein